MLGRVRARRLHRDRRQRLRRQRVRNADERVRRDLPATRPQRRTAPLRPTRQHSPMDRVDHRHDQRIALARTPRRPHDARIVQPHRTTPPRTRRQPLAQLEHRPTRPPPHRIRPVTQPSNGISHLGLGVINNPAGIPFDVAGICLVDLDRHTGSGRHRNVQADIVWCAGATRRLATFVPFTLMKKLYRLVSLFSVTRNRVMWMPPAGAAISRLVRVLLSEPL